MVVRLGDIFNNYMHTYIQTYIHTEPPTERVLEEHSLLKIAADSPGLGNYSKSGRMYT